LPTPNKVAMEFTSDSRSPDLIRALYEAIGAAPKYF
jgi:hypothetical protein